jgi:archaetidylinositol phosphate synthase
VPETAAIENRGHTREVRIQTSVLASLERRALIWMAYRLPPWVTSDQLTALGAVAMAGVGIGYGLARWTPLGLVLASVCLAINWFGDSLDGTLARVRNRQRPRYGYYVDHVIDVAGVLVLMAGLAVSGLLHPASAAALLIAYYLVSLEVYLATHSLGRFRMSMAGIGPTELRLLLIAANVVAVFRPAGVVWGTGLTAFDIGAIASTAVLLVIFVVSAIVNGRRLAAMEALPPAARVRPLL